MPIEPEHPPHVPPLLEVHEVAYRLKSSQESVLRLIRKGKLPAIRVFRTWRIDPVDLKAFIDAHRVSNGNGHHG